jgi:CheY-like chemotaxis protein
MSVPLPPPPKATILVVDDTPQNLRLLETMLTRQGYWVKLAADGQTALAVAGSVQPDLILLDIMMPDLDGYAVCQQFKADPATRDIPIIFITALNDTGDKVKGLTLGGVDYITKPFRLPEVLARVETHLALRRHSYQLTLLNQASRDLAATLDLQRIAEQIQTAVTEIVGAAGTSVWLRDAAQPDWLVCQAAFQPNQTRYSSDLRLPAGQGVAGWVAQTGQGVIIADVALDPRFFGEIDTQTGFHTHSLLAVPLRVREEVIGVLEVVNKTTGEFSQDDQSLVETIAASAAIAIENTWLVNALHQHAVELEQSNIQLQEALDKVKTLSGLLPICSSCKKIRDDQGYWHQIEYYIREHSEADFSHGLCAECAQKLYPDIYQKTLERRQNILDSLTRLKRADLKTIAGEVGWPESNTLNRLHDMVAEGLLKSLETDGQTIYEVAQSDKTPPLS